MLSRNTISKLRRLSDKLRLGNKYHLTKSQHLHSRRLCRIPLLSIVALAFILTISLFPSSYSTLVYADDLENNVSNSIEGDPANPIPLSNDGLMTLALPTASLTIDGNNSSISEKVSATAGKIAVGKTHTIAVSANNIESYDLLLSTVGSSTITNSDGSGTLVAGTPSGDNTWGYVWGSSNTVGDNPSYLPVNGGSLKDSSSGANGMAVSNNTINFTRYLTFAAKFKEGNSNAGTYRANVNLSLVLTPTSTTRILTFDANGGTGGPGTATCQDYDNGCTIAIPTSSNPTNSDSNYKFIGWAENKYDIRATYGADSNNTITINGDKTLYAVWQFTKLVPGFNGINTMQDMYTNPTACSSAANWSYKDLRDTRDNSVYRVVKIPYSSTAKDGKCWMMENLKLTKEGLISGQTVNSTNSDLESGSFTLPNTQEVSASSGQTDSDTSYIYATTSSSTTIADSGPTVYYSWCAAIATNSTACANYTTDGQYSKISICPKGWKLPTGRVVGDTTTNDFYELFNAINTQDRTIVTGALSPSSIGAVSWTEPQRLIVQSSPYSFVYTGYVYDGQLNYPSARGAWWSSTVDNNSTARNLYIRGTYMLPGTDNSNRYYGFAVRCVAAS